MRIKKEDYEKANARLEILLPLVDDSTPVTDSNYIELMKVSSIIENFETEHFFIKPPSLIEAIEYQMYQEKLTKKALSELLEVQPSRISEYLNGKREITLEVAKKLYHKLNIDPEIILQ